MTSDTRVRLGAKRSCHADDCRLLLIFATIAPDYRLIKLPSTVDSSLTRLKKKATSAPYAPRVVALVTGSSLTLM